ncbi:MAG: hypothetical protein M1827_002482 [Pycnora praestabilis]|nr:MAG: hypothetical protein M1827_002482 [Pycnora praestabilis]
MLSSLLRPKKARPRADRSPFSSPYATESSPGAAGQPTIEARRRPAADYNDEAAESGGVNEEDEALDEITEEDEDGDGDATPLLPIFSAAHLDAIPAYHLTHALRLLIVPRCETTLTWDQLRSPQVSQFLVKPIQQTIRTSHFSRATLYALMANCLQFNKEVQMNPGNSGASKTRAMVCELLAIKLLKEFNTRELIGTPRTITNTQRTVANPGVLDALSYDFYPLQGLTPPGTGRSSPGPQYENPHKAKGQPRVARISTLEIAIRAQAKRFLAHPLVVQQLEAIWAGNIVFHSSADSLHRPAPRIKFTQNRAYAAINTRTPLLQAPLDRLKPAKQREHQEPVSVVVRRSVTLYDPRDASLFKLSRLRVPRYRQFLSTCSLAVLLGLFLAVLIQRSLDITSLEIVFWFWSAGFMLDEIVGFNEQGFSLYIMSFWNTFDLGILLLLMVYYGLRLYGILMPDVRKHHVANMAYDFLAANAVLLFPRLFSVLDHYRYFSQLLIAFRMMAMDLVAVFILIVISCSGFFVAFTLSFGDDYSDAGGVAYALFQMLMGFTPAAWDSWPKYNLLGKAILTLFLFICHFLIVTILITVLTNSFMAIVQNANEEHQFVFAVNAISMVKSDALFSYIAPTNVIAWILTPLRYVLPFRQFVRVNRTVIKVTHFPILFVIYSYERMFLRTEVFEATDLVEHRGRSSGKILAFDTPGGGLNLFSPTRRLREHSVATFHKDRALDEVFSLPFRGSTARNAQKGNGTRKTSNVVDHWMQNMPNGRASPPVEQDRAIVDRLETRRTAMQGSKILRRRMKGNARDITNATRSVASDPEEFVLHRGYPNATSPRDESDLPDMSMDSMPEQTDGDNGDDELVTNDEEDRMTLGRGTADTLHHGSDKENQEEDYFQTPKATSGNPILSTSLSSVSRARFLSPLEQPSAMRSSPPRAIRRPHVRNMSSTTILYNPVGETQESSSSPSGHQVTAKNTARNTATGSGALTPASVGRRTPRRAIPATRPRPIMPARSQFQSAPDLAGLMNRRQVRRRVSSMDLDMTSDIHDHFNAHGGDMVGAVPSSFATQMAMATGAVRAGPSHGTREDARMMRLMLTQVHGLEERLKELNSGFNEVVKELKESRTDGSRNGEGEERKGSKAKGKKAVKKTEKRIQYERKASSGGQKTPEWRDELEEHGRDKGSSI